MRDEPRVMITTPSFGRQSPRPWHILEDAGLSIRLPEAAHPLNPDLIVEELGNTPAMIVGLDTVDASVFARAPRLRVVAKHGVGVDNIDLEAAEAAGVIVVNAPGSNSGAVADLTLGLILSLARKIVEAHSAVTCGEWQHFAGMELAGRTLGIAGYGRIGRGVAQRARGFGMRIMAHDPFVSAEAIRRDGVESASWDSLVAESDVLTLHLPGGGGSPLLDAAGLDAMKPGAMIINAARGDLIDEGHLARRLKDGSLGGAALDSFAIEPLPPGHPLRQCPNVILTPHIGAYSDRANELMGSMVARDVVTVLRGGTPEHAVSG